jgi:type IV pilus assembly protein PilC
MATYAYTVQTARGKVKKGKINAPTAEAASRDLRQKGLAPLTLDEATKSAFEKDIRIPGLTDRIKMTDIAIFSRQFATMIDAGLSLLRALAILSEQTESRPLKEIILGVKADIEQGESLSNALGHHPKAFNRLYVAMVKAGEAGGMLDEALLKLADTIEANVELKQRIKAAMMYPVAVMGLVVLIVTAMLIFIVPMFEDLYADLGGDLPAPTRMLLGLSTLFTTYWWAVLIGSVAATFAFKAWKKTEAGRVMWDKIKLRLPIVGNLVHKTAVARFSHTLAALTRTGVPILQAMEIVADTAGNAVFEEAIFAARTSVSEGESISKPLMERDVFPPMVVQMVAVGEETGALDTMLEKIGIFYDNEVKANLQFV